LLENSQTQYLIENKGNELAKVGVPKPSIMLIISRLSKTVETQNRATNGPGVLSAALHWEVTPLSGMFQAKTDLFLMSF
jgi:hypothetical protein